MQKTYNPTWDLDVIFPGGSESEEFYTYLSDNEKEIEKLAAEVARFSAEQPDTIEILAIIVKQLEKITKKTREASAFVSCLSAQDVNDSKAGLLVAKNNEFKAKMDAIQTSIHQKFIQI